MNSTPEPNTLSSPSLEKRMWEHYRDFFDKAERKRRWKITDDIPWDEVNPNHDPAIADVVESFTAVELYLPDYTGKILPLVRESKGRAWFYANWGYEESKHSLALGDWLLKSGARTEEYMADLERRVFEREWNLPHDSALGMMAYAMVQELATFVNYRNLRERCRERGGDPALEKLLVYVSVDEKAHYAFFRDCLKMYMEEDRESALVALRRVLNHFTMPVIHDLLDNSERRIGEVRDLAIFDETIFFRDVYMEVLTDFGLTRNDMRDGPKAKKSMKGVTA